MKDINDAAKAWTRSMKINALKEPIFYQNCCQPISYLEYDVSSYEETDSTDIEEPEISSK